ncbi:MAG: hypothetical protein ACI9TI_000356, partial [Natronomonas sp.]
ATAIRDDELDHADSGRYLKLFGVDNGRLLEPMFVTRTGPELPAYDLHEVADTLAVRVTESEFGA